MNTKDREEIDKLIYEVLHPHPEIEKELHDRKVAIVEKYFGLVLKEQRAEIVRELEKILENRNLTHPLHYQTAIAALITKLERGEEE